MIKQKYNFIYIIFFLVLLIAYFRYIQEINSISVLNNIINFGLVIFSTIYLMANSKFYNSKFIYSFIILLLILVINIIYRDFQVSEYMKIIGAFSLFAIGYKSQNNTFIFSKKNNTLKRVLLLMYLFPLISFIIEKFNGSGLEYSLLVNSNNFIFYGVVISFVYSLHTNSLKNYFLLSIVYLFFASTIGAYISYAISLLIFTIVNKTIKINIKQLLSLVFIVSILIILPFIFNLEISNRIIDTFNIYKSLEVTSYKELVDVNYGYAASFAEDSKNVSFLFRIKHWTEIIGLINDSSLFEILFGHGEYSLNYDTFSGLRGHNDYLTILYEYGIIVLFLILFALYYLIKKLSNSYCLLPLLFFVFYLFTENIFTHFMTVGLLFFTLGKIAKIKKNNHVIVDGNQ